MKSTEDVMEILEAFDLTGSLRAAAGLAGCSHHTVGRYVGLRDDGKPPDEGFVRPRLIDDYLAKVEELAERSKGRVRADVVHEKLVALGYKGSERSTRRAVAEVKHAYAAGRRRVYRPWIPEPGMWFQWDYGQGPKVRGRDTLLFCAWLAWSRFRVVIPIRDKTLPTVIGCIDSAMRAFCGVPTYGLTDNEKTVTVAHVAGIPVRNREFLEAGRHYGLTAATCVPADPETKGGSEATVRVAKADLVPTDANLLPEYGNFAELEGACRAFCEEVNSRPHRETRRAPVEMLAEERRHLHPVPETPYTAAFGTTRVVNYSSLVSFGGVRYSVPHGLIEEIVWVREQGDELVIVHVGKGGPREVARHRLSTPGRPQILEEHYPPRPEGALARTPRPRDEQEEAFLGIGVAAQRWLIEAAAAGTSRLKVKMVDALALASLYGAGELERALATAAQAGRFGDGDLASILNHQSRAGALDSEPALASESHSLQPGTRAWEALR